MSDIESESRLLSFESPLGADKLFIRTLEGREAISDLFSFSLELVSTDFDIEIKDLIGKKVTIGIRLADGESFRYIRGVVSNAQALGGDDRLALYFAEVVPELWLLTKTQDCRIYQEIAIPEIVNDVLGRFNVLNKEISCTGTHNAWTYCTQYRETAHNFISRLMESEGIFYFFEHLDSVTKVVVADSKSIHSACPGQSRFKLEKSYGAGANRLEDVILSWEYRRTFRSGKYTHRDFNYETPTTDLLHEEPTREVVGGSDKFEVYDYPGEYEDRADASAWAKLRMEEEEVEQRTYHGRGTGRAMMPGCKFELTGHDKRELNGWYVITSVVHHAVEGSFLSGGNAEDSTYTNSFTCIPLDIPYRPPRKTEKHIMRGLQTALVVGPSGEEIYNEEMGRIKIQFHWDRLGQNDADSSCWVRVMQPWAGKDRGTNFLPRIGDEVVVAFMEGDPDRPLVIGSVYNPVSYNPWEMPNRKNWTGIKTKSTTNGGSEDANELRLDDTAGQELFMIRAQKDMEVSAENDLYEEYTNDVHRTVGGNNRYKLTGNHESEVSGNYTSKIGGSVKEEITGSVDRKISGAMNLGITGGLSIDVTGRVAIQGMGGISLIGPSGHVDINASGVVIQGPMLYLNCGMPHSGPPSPAITTPPTAPTKPDKYQLK